MKPPKIFTFLKDIDNKIQNAILENNKLMYPVRKSIYNSNKYKSVGNTRLWRMGTRKG